MLTRPLGAIRDELGTERGAPIRRLIGSAREGLPDAWDLRGPWTRYPMQIGQSCTGHALAQAVRTLSKGDLDPSAMAVYAIGRQIGSPYVSRLSDGGAYTSRVLKGAADIGIVGRDRWPDDSDPSDRVPQDVVEAGSLAVDTEIYRIWETVDELPDAIRRSVSAGYPVPYVQDVDRGYMNHRGPGVWTGIEGDVVGAHAQCIVAYRRDAVGVAGSWGDDWADGGLAWIGWSFFESPRVYDVQVLKVVPRRLW